MERRGFLSRCAPSPTKNQFSFLNCVIWTCTLSGINYIFEFLHQSKEHPWQKLDRHLHACLPCGINLYSDGDAADQLYRRRFTYA